MPPQRIDRGDIFWVDAEALRPSVPGVAHPAVVVQDDRFNHSRIPSVVVCGITSRLQTASEPGNVLLEPSEGGLPKRSVVLVSQLSVVDKDRMGQRLGQLGVERVEQVLRGIAFVERMTRR